MALTFIIALSVAKLVIATGDRPEYCIAYYGNVSAQINLAPAAVNKNSNKTITCPHQWKFDPEQGGIFHICPPTPYDPFNNFGSTVVPWLYKRSNSTTNRLKFPIDFLRLEAPLVTNGSSKYNYPSGSVPALLAEDPARSNVIVPVWTINGTHKALVPPLGGNNDDGYSGTSLSCAAESDEGQTGGFCGVPGSADDCWSVSDFRWVVSGEYPRQSHTAGATSLDFTIRFSKYEASVEIWTEQELLNASSGETTGQYTKAYIMFSGKRQLPSPDNIGFWGNSDTFYETAAEYPTTFDFEIDENHFPVFVNRSEKVVKYFVGNGTYYSEANTLLARAGIAVALPMILVLSLLL
jgi:hypothetical protein